VGLFPPSSSGGAATSGAGVALPEVVRKRRGLGLLAGRRRLLDAVADPYITVTLLGGEEEEEGDDESSSYFPINKHRFRTLTDCRTPVWDAKCVLIGKKKKKKGGGGSGNGGIEFVVYDHDKAARGGDKEMYRLTLDASDLPSVTAVADSTWTSYSVPVTKVGGGGGDGDEDGSSPLLSFKLMVTDGSDRVVTPAMMGQMMGTHQHDDGYEYSEVVLKDRKEEDKDGSNALVQCWKKKSNTRAVLWVLGRNDCFMHPHVARKLFFQNGYDLYVLNYKLNGMCRSRGWVTDAHWNSHVPTGTFDTYLDDVKGALEVMSGGGGGGGDDGYETLLGYAHSTGGTVLLNYLMEEGDDAFDAFLFNSPFLDWGFVGGDMAEFALENSGVLAKLGMMNLDTMVGTAVTPPAIADRPLTYRNRDVVISDWSARLWSMYHFDFESRPMYSVPMTVGFAKAVTDVQEKMRALHEKSKRPITTKPFLCITSRGDDVLKAGETLSRADWIGPSRWEVELNDNGHDVFLSYDAADTTMALDMCLAWMKNRRLL
jgi:alpha-beta hydrolase superfamily lysophospholipase